MTMASPHRARASVFHEYICERCSAPMVMSEVEYEDRAHWVDDKQRKRTSKVVCDDCAGIPPTKRKPRRKPEPKPRVRTNTKAMRDDAGVIVTARDQSTQQMDTIHVAGFMHDALREAVRELEEREGNWKIVTICTPRTILVDLQGQRSLNNPADRDPRAAVENRMLGRIGRLDMLEPRVRGYARSAA